MIAMYIESLYFPEKKCSQEKSIRLKACATLFPKTMLTYPEAKN